MRNIIHTNRAILKARGSRSGQSIHALSSISTESLITPAEHSTTASSEFTETTSQLSINTTTTNYHSMTEISSITSSTSYSSLCKEPSPGILDETISFPEQDHIQTQVYCPVEIFSNKPQPLIWHSTCLTLSTKFVQRRTYVKGKEDDLSKKIADTIRTELVDFENNKAVVNLEIDFIQQKKEWIWNHQWNCQFQENTVVIYTDGSSMGTTASGFGIFCGPGNEMNRAQKLILGENERHDNTLAELAGAIFALDNIRRSPHYNKKDIIIRTDSLEIIKGLKRQQKGGNKRFPQYYAIILELVARFESNISVQHVHAHDKFGHSGNDVADALARLAMESSAQIDPSKSTDIKRSKKRDRRQEAGWQASFRNCPVHIKSHSFNFNESTE